jgi:hypothetical protein
MIVLSFRSASNLIAKMFIKDVELDALQELHLKFMAVSADYD